MTISQRHAKEVEPVRAKSDVRDISLREAMNSRLFIELRDGGYLLEDHPGDAHYILTCSSDHSITPSLSVLLWIKQTITKCIILILFVIDIVGDIW